MDSQELTTNIIYLMGGSFIVGSLFTILALLLLDIMRGQQPPQEPPSGSE